MISRQFNCWPYRKIGRLLLVRNLRTRWLLHFYRMCFLFTSIWRLACLVIYPIRPEALLWHSRKTIFLLSQGSLSCLHVLRCFLQKDVAMAVNFCISFLAFCCRQARLMVPIAISRALKVRFHAILRNKKACTI